MRPRIELQLEWRLGSFLGKELDKGMLWNIKCDNSNTFPSHLTPINVWAKNKATEMGCGLDKNNWSGTKVRVS